MHFNDQILQEKNMWPKAAWETHFQVVQCDTVEIINFT